MRKTTFIQIMRLALSSLTTERKWRAATGLTKIKFERLLQWFKEAYGQLVDLQIAKRDQFAVHESIIRTEEDLLFFTLFSFKSNLTYDLLGIVCGMDTANAKRYQDRGIAVLQQALENAGQLPKREFETVAEFEAYFQQ